MIKTIDSIQYHVWSDALHARQLARQTENKWDRGAYVRWSIQTAWSAFENVCVEALAASGLGMRFKDRFDEALANKSLPSVDWSRGIWQQVLKVYGVRKDFVHVVPSVSHQTLLTPVADAEDAISVLRAGIKSVLDLVGMPYPAWVTDDEDRGWYGPRGVGGSMACVTRVCAGANENDSEVIRITYLLRGNEHVCEIAPAGTPHGPILDKLVGSVNVPVDAVRAYCGSVLLEERIPNLR